MINLNIIYEDNHIIVVEKPINILSQSDNTNDIDLLTLVKEYIKTKYNKKGNVYVGLVHRLDRPVGGIMVFAKTSKAASRLSEQIRKKEFNKNYLAVIIGNLIEKNGIFEDYINRNSNNFSYIDNKNGKYSKLSYKTIEYRDNLTLVDINLETGRHHQIRIQFAQRGFPLYGDQRYGKQDKQQLALYAYKIKFTHPTQKNIMEFTLKPKPIGIWRLFNNINNL